MTDDPQPGFHQRRYLVDKRFQFKYTAMVIILSSIVFAILGYELYRKTIANTEILQIQNIDVKGLVTLQDRQILYLLGGFFLLQVASLFVLGILITHRIAGPMFRVQKFLEDIAEKGEIRPLNPVRSRDEFQGFFDSLSRVVSMLNSQSESRKMKLEEARHAAEAARRDPAQVDRVCAVLDELKKKV